MTRPFFTFSQIVLASLLFLPAVASAQDFKPIFDGQSLKGWDGDPKFWSVKDGAITGQTTKENPTKGNTFIIWKDGELADFELKLKFKIVGGNSGIQYRSKDNGNWVVGGYQADFDGNGDWTGTLYEERGRGILAKRGSKVEIGEGGAKSTAAGATPEKEILEAVKKEDWNEYEVIAQGNHLIHKVNGKVTIDVTDNETARQVSKGILALQLHAGPPMTVQFKDIQLKVLK
jgi:hypothetical protein